LDKIFKTLAGSNTIKPKELNCWGRKLVIEQTAGRIAKTTFNQLCVNVYPELTIESKCCRLFTIS
jgi:predicted ATPase